MSDVYGIAREYGRALFMLTEELGTTERVRDEARAVAELLSSNSDYVKMLDTPALTADERVSLVDGAFGTLDTNLLNLLKILAQRRLSYAMTRTLRSYEDEYMESRGIIRAEVVSAIALNDAQSEALATKLSGVTGKQVILVNKVDPSILGGIKLRYMGIQRDGSVKTRLDDFARSLGETVI